MPLATPNRDGGSANERGILRSVGRIVTGNVQSGFRVRQNSPLGMSVLIGGETGIPDDLFIRNTAYSYAHPVFIDDGVAISLTVPTANTSNPRIDVVVIYVDYGQIPVDTYANNTNGVIKAKLVQGLAAAVPTKPTNSDILAAIGASNYYTELATILLPANASTVTDSMITDTRSMTTPVLKDKSVTSAKLDLSKTTDANGWTVYDYGNWKKYTKAFAIPAQTIGTGGGLLTLTGNNLPSGVSSIGTLKAKFSLQLAAGSPFLVSNFDGSSANTTVNIGVARTTGSASYSGTAYVELSE